MNPSETIEVANPDRRRLLGAAAVALAAAPFGLTGTAHAEATKPRKKQLPPIRLGTDIVFTRLAP